MKRSKQVKDLNPLVADKNAPREWKDIVKVKAPIDKVRLPKYGTTKDIAKEAMTIAAHETGRRYRSNHEHDSCNIGKAHMPVDLSATGQAIKVHKPVKGFHNRVPIVSNGLIMEQAGEHKLNSTPPIAIQLNKLMAHEHRLIGQVTKAQSQGRVDRLKALSDLLVANRKAIRAYVHHLIDTGKVHRQDIPAYEAILKALS